MKSLKIHEMDRAFILDALEGLTDRLVRMGPVEWAEKKRYLPPGTTPQHGPWRAEVAPYVVEILNQLAPGSPAVEVVIAKGVQIGMTSSVAENTVGWTIDVDPCAMMYVTADEAMARTRMEVAIDPMIDASGLRSKIFSQTEKNQAGRKGGDTQLRKEFPGGYLQVASIQSSNRGRSLAIRRLILDEVDAAKKELGKDGDPVAVFKARTDAYAATRKILYISTPLEKHSSKIWPLWELGDQRRYFVPCPTCGHMQYLKWSQLKFETQGGRLDLPSVHYVCEKDGCGAQWKNHDKVYLLKHGQWRATGTAQRAGLVSYHISALYSPVGFKSWESIAQDWIEAQQAKQHGDLSKLRTFVNLNLGEPWEERGEAPRYEIIMARRGSYHYTSGHVPDDGPLILTAGTDVQGNRLETEIVAWGRNKCSWSYGYEVIQGDVTDPQTWQKLAELYMRERYTVSGRKLPVVLAFVDSGYKPDVVYQFCAQMQDVMPCMGMPTHNVKRWKEGPFKSQKVQGHDTMRFDLDVNFLKEESYSNLKRGLNADDSYPPGFCFFPADYGEKYFRMLTAEERIQERDKFGNVRMRWYKRDYRANEALDCRVYALGALYAYAYDMCIHRLKMESISWDSFFDCFSP